MSYATINSRMLTQDQRSDAWYKARDAMLTASMVPSLLGLNPFESFDEAVTRKKHERHGHRAVQSSPAIDHGVACEPLAKAVFETRAMPSWAHAVQEVGLVKHPSIEWLGASPDGVVVDARGKTRALLEIKCPFNRPIAHEPSPCYLAQIQHQLEVCDVATAFLLEARFDVETHELIEWRCTQVDRDAKRYKTDILPVLKSAWQKIRAPGTRMRLRSRSDASGTAASTSTPRSPYHRNVDPVQVRGFLSKDPLQDWLRLYGTDHGYARDARDEFVTILAHEKRKLVQSWATLLVQDPGTDKHWSIGARILQRWTPGKVLPDRLNPSTHVPTTVVYKRRVKTRDVPPALVLLEKMHWHVVTLAWRADAQHAKWGAFLCREHKVVWVNLEAARNKWGRCWSDARGWLATLQRDGASWDPKTHARLAPNMNQYGNGGWHGAKQALAHQRGELSLVWQVPAPAGKKRKRLDDPTVTAAELGVTDKYRPNVDAILRANRRKRTRASYKRLGAQRPKVPAPPKGPLAFVDLEFLPKVLQDTHAPTAQLYLIGVHWYDAVNKRWTTTQFMTRSLAMSEERRVLQAFFTWIDNHAPAALVHWSAAEPSQIRSALKRHPTLAKPACGLPWWDLMQALQDGCAAFPGCTRFRLKDVTEALCAQGALPASMNYHALDCAGAVSSMVQAWRHYGTWCPGVQYVKTDPCASILKYNELDCEVLRLIGAHVGCWTVK